MRCGFDREIIQKYADNTIDPLEFIFLKEHINYCDECRNELSIAMTLENELNDLFDEQPDSVKLDLLINNLVDECMSDFNKREKLKYAFNRSFGIGSTIVVNSMRFKEFIPGRRALGKGIKATASLSGNLLTFIIRKKAGRLLNYVRL